MNFELVGKSPLKLSPAYAADKYPPSYSRLMTSSSKYGYAVIGLTRGLCWISLADLRSASAQDSSELFDQKSSILPFPSEECINHVCIDGSEEIVLAVSLNALTKSSTLHFYHAKSLENKKLNAMKTVSLPGCRVVQGVSHPKDSLFFLLTSDYSSFDCNTLENGFTFQVYSLSEGAYLDSFRRDSVCQIHRTEDHLYLGLVNGQVLKYDYNGSLLDTLDISVGHPIRWLTTSVDGKVLAGTVENDNTTSVVIQEYSEKFEDICFPESDYPGLLNFHSIHLKKWDKIDESLVIAFSGSIDSCTLTKSSDKWEKVELDENARIELPLPLESQFSGCVGMATDLCDNEQLQRGDPDSPPLPPMPICLCLTMDGTLLAYRIIMKGNSYSGMVKSAALLPEPVSKSTEIKSALEIKDSESIVPASLSSLSISFGSAVSKPEAETKESTMAETKPTSTTSFGSSISSSAAITKPVSSTSSSSTFSFALKQESSAPPNFGFSLNTSSKPSLSEAVSSSEELSPAPSNKGFGLGNVLGVASKSDFSTNKTLSSSFGNIPASKTESSKLLSEPAAFVKDTSATTAESNVPRSDSALPASMKTPTQDGSLPPKINLPRETAELLKPFNKLCSNISGDIEEIKSKVEAIIPEISKELDNINYTRHDDYIASLQGDINVARESVESVDDKLKEIKEKILECFTKLAEGESYLITKSKYSAKVKFRRLLPEQENQQKNIRSRLRKVKDQLEDLEEFLARLRSPSDPEDDFSIDTLYRTLRNLSCSALTKSNELGSMEAEVESLMRNLGIQDVPTLEIDPDEAISDSGEVYLRLDNQIFSEQIKLARHLVFATPLSKSNTFEASKYDVILCSKQSSPEKKSFVEQAPKTVPLEKLKERPILESFDKPKTPLVKETRLPSVTVSPQAAPTKTFEFAQDLNAPAKKSLELAKEMKPAAATIESSSKPVSAALSFGAPSSSQVADIPAKSKPNSGFSFASATSNQIPTPSFGFKLGSSESKATSGSSAKPFTEPSAPDKGATAQKTEESLQTKSNTTSESKSAPSEAKKEDTPKIEAVIPKSSDVSSLQPASQEKKEETMEEVSKEDNGKIESQIGSLGFGSQGVATSTPSKSVFGLPTTAATTSQTVSAPATTLGFGSSLSQPVSSTTFGTPSFGATSFGQAAFPTTQTATPALFANTPAAPATSSPVTAFGPVTQSAAAPQQPQQPSAFGSTAFGSPAFGASAFGKPSFGQSSFGSPAFGQSSFGSPAFGQSAFGSATPASPSPAAANSQATPKFGQMASGFGQVSFGNLSSTSPGTSAFGQQQQQGTSNPSFSQFRG